jgi:DNA-binding IclR family transcriptional regulator
VDGRFQVRVLALQLGGRLPVHCGAAPVALLLGMSDAEITTLLRNHTYTRYTDNTIQTLDDLLSTVHASQARGYVLSWEDVTPGVAAIGAPVRDHTGHVVAAISVAGIIQRFSPERRAFLANTVTGAARSLSQDLGYTGSPPPVQQT